MDNLSVLLKFEICSELGTGQGPKACRRAPAMTRFRITAEHAVFAASRVT